MPTWKKTQNPDILPWWSQNTDLTQLKQLIEEKAEEWDVEGLNNLLKEVQHNKSLNQEDIKSLETLVNEKIQSIKEQTQEAVNALANTIPHSNQIPAMSENNPTPTDWMWGESNTNSAPSNTDETGLFSETKKWIWETWDDVRNQEKRKTEPWKNTLRTVGFAATWIWALVLAYKWIKWWVNKLKGFFSGENELRKKMGKIETQLAQLNDDFLNERDPTEKNNIRKNIEKLEDMKKEIKEKLAENLEWNNEDDKAKKEKPWWKKFLIWAWIATWTVIWWVSIYKHWPTISSKVKERLGWTLNFDDSLTKVSTEIANGIIDSDHFWVFHAHFDGITYDESTEELCSYWEKTKITKTPKKLQGLDVEFNSWEELIHAANIVNFAKKHLRWRWKTEHPFCETKFGWDIAFNALWEWKPEFISWSNGSEWEYILWATWWLLWWYFWKWPWIALWGSLAWIIGWAMLDEQSDLRNTASSVRKWVNFDKFLNYLNGITENGKSIRCSCGEQHIDPTATPINWLVDNGKEWGEREWVLAEIEQTYWIERTWQRKLDIIWDERNPEKYIIHSFGSDLPITIKWWPTNKSEKINYSSIQEIHIDNYSTEWDETDEHNKPRSKNGLNLEFPPTEEWLKEAIRVANLTNMLVFDQKCKGSKEYPFWYHDWEFRMDTPFLSNWKFCTTILKQETLKEKYPTLLADLEHYHDINEKWDDVDHIWGWIKQSRLHTQAIKDENKWSQYIKFLHQIWKGNFWKWS